MSRCYTRWTLPCPTHAGSDNDIVLANWTAAEAAPTVHLSLAMYDKAANREPGTNWTSSLKGQTYLLTAVFLVRPHPKLQHRQQTPTSMPGMGSWDQSTCRLTRMDECCRCCRHAEIAAGECDAHHATFCLFRPMAVRCTGPLPIGYKRCAGAHAAADCVPCDRGSLTWCCEWCGAHRQSRRSPWPPLQPAPCRLCADRLSLAAGACRPSARASTDQVANLRHHVPCHTLE